MNHFFKKKKSLQIFLLKFATGKKEVTIKCGVQRTKDKKRKRNQGRPWNSGMEKPDPIILPSPIL